jgi:hypothetical protein
MKRSWKTIQRKPNEILTSIAYECGILGTVLEILEQLLPPNYAKVQVVEYTCFNDDDPPVRWAASVPATDKPGKSRVEIRIDHDGITLAGPKKFSDIDEYATVIQELSSVAINELQRIKSKATPFTPKFRRIICLRTVPRWRQFRISGNGRR